MDQLKRTSFKASSVVKPREEEPPISIFSKSKRIYVIKIYRKTKQQFTTQQERQFRPIPLNSRQSIKARL